MGWFLNMRFKREMEAETERVCCVVRPTLRKLRAEDMFETWVSRGMDHTASVGVMGSWGHGAGV